MYKPKCQIQLHHLTNGLQNFLYQGNVARFKVYQVYYSVEKSKKLQKLNVKKMTLHVKMFHFVTAYHLAFNISDRA